MRDKPPCEDVVYLQQASLRIGNMLKEIDDLTRGRLTFNSTETWRTVYETILSTSSTKRYLSVALIETDGYWRTAPAGASLQFNYQLVEHGFYVHRLFIIDEFFDEFFWPPASPVSAQEILSWIGAQYIRGIESGLVRLADLEKEPHLICDMGIYGRRAIGYQTLDTEGNTAHFELRFDSHSLRAAEQRWDQLRLYEISLDLILDQPH